MTYNAAFGVNDSWDSYYSLEDLEKKSIPTVSDFSLKKVIYTIKEIVLSFFTKLGVVDSSFDPKAYPLAQAAIANLRNRGFQLTSNTLNEYLKSQKVHFFGDFFMQGTRAPLERAQAEEAGSRIADSLGAKFAEARTVSIPVIVKGITGSHIVNVKCTMVLGVLQVDFMDSKGLSLFHPKNEAALILVQKIKDVFQNMSISASDPVQYDVHSCAVYVALHATSDSAPPKDINEFRGHMVSQISLNPAEPEPVLNDDEVAYVDIFDADSEL